MSDPLKEERDWHAILDRVRQSQGFDGRHYKPNYLKRRIAVRMRAVGVSTYPDYLRILESDPLEAEALIKRLTIHVTEFFRDADVHRAVEEKVLSGLEGNADPISTRWMLRVWCAACSTGEEPYSLAMLLSEWIETRPGWDFHIIATDIDDASIQTAVKGEYPEASISRLAPPRVSRWFSCDGGKARVKESLKERVRFKVHDLLGPWPEILKGFDLVYCRNLLIYLGSAQQQILYGRFHQVMNPGSYLVLGRTEALLGLGRRLFECTDIPNRIYRSVKDEGSEEGKGDPDG